MSSLSLPLPQCAPSLLPASTESSAPSPSSRMSTDGPSRAKQLACLQASIRLIQSGRPVVGATGEWVQLGGSACSPAMLID